MDAPPSNRSALPELDPPLSGQPYVAAAAKSAASEEKEALPRVAALEPPAEQSPVARLSPTSPLVLQALGQGAESGHAWLVYRLGRGATKLRLLCSGLLEAAGPAAKRLLGVGVAPVPRQCSTHTHTHRQQRSPTGTGCVQAAPRSFAILDGPCPFPCLTGVVVA